ncbi:MAG: peptidoglycan editing factor PgeF [Firmicutes bacterium]|nr:peptidoglycan editing factor PgeF [Bacillota bacterium]
MRATGKGTGVTVWQVAAWADLGIRHGFTDRRGGVSLSPYDSLNLGFHVGDDPARVRENRRRACEALGVSPGSLVVAQQVHGARVAVVTREDAGRGAEEPAGAVPGADALITADAGPVLAGLYADCVPVLLFDPKTPAAGLVHAGWRGTAQVIAARAVEAMREAFGTRPEDCLAAIGPSIGPCCYEVGSEVADRFGPSARRYFMRKGGRWHLDLWQANREALEAAGLPAAAIWTAQVCTCCRSDLFFSHRGSGGRTGRMAALIGL